MGRFGAQEMMVVLVVALLVFRPDQLPDVARKVGGALARLRRETRKALSDLEQAGDVKGLRRDVAKIRSEYLRARGDLRSLLDESSLESEDANAMARSGANKPVNAMAPPYDTDWT